ncbi:MAG: succinylglutamate desuccinylase/aspartoacylase family protein [Alphaproteobacteria bacterium]|nr:succinylglutamate desuccinylase/aspartoacylase family protein [Alphaproteobacteria bacterium]
MTQPPVVEIAAPDIAGFRDGGTGIPYVVAWDSGQPGLHVVVTALVHGNELCGAHAATFLHERGIRPRRGRLTVALCNVDAYRRFDPLNPTASRYVDEDFNRVWDVATLDGPRTSIELRRARELRPLIDTADLLLDVHSMQTTARPLVLSGPLAKGLELARQVGVPELVVVDGGHAAGRRMRDYGGFGDPASARNALLVECGQHWTQLAVDIAIETTLRFLVVTGAIDPADAAPHLPATRPSPQRVVEVTQAVTVSTPEFAFIEDYSGLEVIPRAGTTIAHDGTAEVRTPYDDCVLIMPSKRLTPGQTAVRLGRFIV